MSHKGNDMLVFVDAFLWFPNERLGPFACLSSASDGDCSAFPRPLARRRRSSVRWCFWRWLNLTVVEYKSVCTHLKCSSILNYCKCFGVFWSLQERTKKENYIFVVLNVLQETSSCWNTQFWAGQNTCSMWLSVCTKINCTWRLKANAQCLQKPCFPHQRTPGRDVLHSQPTSLIRVSATVDPDTVASPREVSPLDSWVDHRVESPVALRTCISAHFYSIQ